VVRLPAPARPLFPYLKPAYVGATRLIAPAAQRLSRRRDALLPTGAVETLDEAARRSGGQCFIAREAEVISRGMMTGLPAGLPLTDRGDGESVPAVRVATLPGARVLGPHRAVITGRGDLVQEVSRYFGTSRPREHPLFLNPYPPPPLSVPGRLGVLAARGDSNYYHFLIDVLPRLGVLEQSPSVPRPAQWYVPTALPFHDQLLDRLGIAASQRVSATDHPHVRADELVVPGLPATTEKNPPWVVEWLRSRLLPGIAVDGPRTRIYVTRGASANNRAVRNEDAVQALLAEYGFVGVDPGSLSVDEQIRTFARAELIVAAHGAALANLVFCSPGTRVIELFPAGYLLPDYWRLASGVPGLSYRYLSAPARSRLGLRNRGAAIVTDIDVDLAGLRRLVAEVSDVSDVSERTA
jgi:capsular polysaccharide biosynthesis protein